MIGRILWLAALAGIGVITAQLQLDRQSAREPEWSEWVAAPFRGYAQEQVAAEALALPDNEAALSEARVLLQRRPVPAEHLTLLAKAFAKSGDGPAALATIQLAAQRGWRDPVVQEAMARLAINANDMPEAARRFTALMVLGENNNELLSTLAGDIFADPDSAGIPTLATIIRDAERWKLVFMRRGPQVMPPAGFTQVVAEAIEQGGRLDCQGLARANKAITRRDAAAGQALETIRAAHCAYSTKS
jgi:hypothetical protein